MDRRILIVGLLVGFIDEYVAHPSYILPIKCDSLAILPDLYALSKD